MNGQRFCPHCGERIAVDAEQKYCMFCGEPLDIFVPKAYYDPEPSYKPSWSQTLAAILLPISAFFGIFSSQLVPNLTMKMDNTAMMMMFISLISPALSVCALALLRRRANNIATRTALHILLAIPIYNILFTLLVVGLGENYKAFNYIALITQLAFVIASVYAYSLVVRNNKLSKTNRTWINLLGVFKIVGFIGAIGILATLTDPMSMEIGMFFSLSGFSFFFIDYFAMWKFARCEAFSNDFNAEVIPDYSPKSRQMAMAAFFFAILFIIPALFLSLTI